jgi:uncharacterized protein
MDTYAQGLTVTHHPAKRIINLRIVHGLYGIAKLAQDALVPGWINGPGLSAVIRADDELTLVCLQDRIPDHVEAALNWQCLRSVGPFEFDASGIVLSIISPLSEQGVGVFVICTFDGEHILVADQHWKKSLSLLKEAGHVFID